MKLIHHKSLNQERWHHMPLAEQLANIGSEVERTIIWKNKQNKEYSDLAFERALELTDLTTEALKNIPRLRELLPMREALCDWYAGDNEYHSTDKLWQDYFMAYNFLARLGK